MKVFILTNYTLVDFQCGDTTIEGVYTTFDKAFAKVKEQLPNATPDKGEWTLWDNGLCDAAWLYINEHEVE